MSHSGSVQLTPGPHALDAALSSPVMPTAIATAATATFPSVAIPCLGAFNQGQAGGYGSRHQPSEHATARSWRFARLAFDLARLPVMFHGLYLSSKLSLHQLDGVHDQHVWHPGVMSRWGFGLKHLAAV